MITVGRPHGRASARPRRRRPEALPSGSRPRVSVVVPCFDYERYLRAAVASVLDQPGVEVDVIIVDDRSRDGSLALARRLAAADPRVAVVAHRTNRGPVDTFNDGLERAQGRYLVRLDADDLLARGALARAVALLEAEPSVGLAYGRPVHFTGDRVPASPRTKVTGWTIWPGATWLERRCRAGWNCITAPEVVMRRSVVEVVGGQRPELAFAHDMEMWLRMAAVADVGHLEGPDQAYHRDHEASMTSTSTKLMDLQDRRLVFETLFDGHDLAIADGDRLQHLARRALAAEALDEACRSLDRTSVHEPIEPYVTFAREVCPDATSLRQWHALQARRRVGPGLAPYVPHFFAHAVSRRVRAQLAHWRWLRRGV